MHLYILLHKQAGGTYSSCSHWIDWIVVCINFYSAKMHLFGSQIQYPFEPITCRLYRVFKVRAFILTKGNGLRPDPAEPAVGFSSMWRDSLKYEALGDKFQAFMQACTDWCDVCNAIKLKTVQRLRVVFCMLTLAVLISHVEKIWHTLCATERMV